MVKVLNGFKVIWFLVTFCCLLFLPFKCPPVVGRFKGFDFSKLPAAN